MFITCFTVYSPLGLTDLTVVPDRNQRVEIRLPLDDTSIEAVVETSKLLWLQYKLLNLFHPFFEIAIDVCMLRVMARGEEDYVELRTGHSFCWEKTEGL
jgi:hypothetical protein